MEYLDVVDTYGNPTGRIVSRDEAHRLAFLHRTAHVWIIRRRAGRMQVLLQKRSHHKDSYPDQWDISSAGHIPAGESWGESAVRELREELGISIPENRLTDIGCRRIDRDDIFHGEPFCDRQISKIFLLPLDLEEGSFVPQKEELSEVRWYDLDSAIDDTRKGRLGTCLDAGELETVREAALRSAGQVF